MGARRNDVRVVLQILMEMAQGATGPEMAEALGYKAEDSVYRVIDTYDLREVERRLKQLYGAQAAEIPPEVLEINEEYKSPFKEISDRLKELKPPKTDGQVLDPLDEINFLNAKMGALSKTRAERVILAGLQSEGNRKKKMEAQDASRFDDLLEE